MGASRKSKQELLAENAELRRQVAALEREHLARPPGLAGAVSRQFLINLFNNVPFAILIFEQSGQFVASNQACVDLFGATPPPEYNFFDDKIAQSFGGDKAVREMIAESRLFHDFGTIDYDPSKASPELWGDREPVRFWFHSVAFLVMDEMNQPSHFVVLHQNVSDHIESDMRREAVEKKLEQEQNFLHKIITLNPYSIIVHDQKGRFLYANQAFFDLVLGGKHVLPGPDWTIFDDPLIAGANVRDQLDKVVSGDATSFQTQFFVNPANFAEKFGFTNEGLDKNLVLDVTVFGIRDEDDELRNIVVMQSDVTDHIEAQKLRQSAETRLTTVINQLHDSVAVLDRNLNVTYQSPSARRFLGWTTDDLLTVDVDAIIHPDDLPVMMTMVQNAHAKPGEPMEGTVRLMHKEGGYRIVAFTGRNLLDDPDINGFLVNARDITEQRDLEREQRSMQSQIQQMQKLEALGTMAGGIAHDFNTVLAVIKGFSEVTRDTATDDNAIYNLEQILIAVERAKGLVEKMLIFSRQIEHERRPIAMRRVVEEAMKLLAGYLPPTIRIRREFAADAGFVVADPTEIHQIILNLCINAYDAMADSGGTLTVRLAKQPLFDPREPDQPQDLPAGLYCRLTVIDDGIGMDEQTAARAFEPFYSTKAVGRGTGMGLAVVHGIVTDYGGEILVCSRLGEGAVFDIYLPLHEEEVEAEPAKIVAPAPGGSEAILLVDDEPQIVEILTATLSGLGYRVTGYTEPTKALDAFQADPAAFDLVITDQVMPDISGLRLAVTMRETRADVPILLTSAFERQETLDRLAEHPRMRFLRKPFDRVILATTIRELFDE
jgi:PAS domain S-box-containing protein